MAKNKAKIEKTVTMSREDAVEMSLLARKNQVKELCLELISRCDGLLDSGFFPNCPHEVLARALAEMHGDHHGEEVQGDGSNVH